MAPPRKGCAYRQYIRKDGNVNIPDSTWRRWLKQGRVSKEQLIGLGIQPCRRRRNQNQPVLPSEEGLQPRSPTTHSEIEQHHNSPENPTSTTVNNSTSIEEHSTEAISAADGVDMNDNDQSDLTSEDYDSFSLSDFSSFSDNENPVHGNKLLGSVLESSNIGVDKLNEPLVPSLQVSKFETLLMILHLALRHGYTDAFLEDMMCFVNEVVGVEDAIPKTKFLFNKLFLFASAPIIHFFCPTCNIYLGLSSAFKQTVNCEKCETTNSTSSLNGGNYFLSLRIRDQVKDVLNRSHIKLVNRDHQTDKVISDMNDGILYKSIMTDGESLIVPDALTISFNCDGSPVFKSGPNSLWPIQFIINELHPEQRFEAENTLLAGLWFSKTKPTMEIFLQPFINELQVLQKDGVVWRKPDGSLCESPLFAISCCLDSPAKAQVQKVMQFNGRFGCGYCMHPNSPITVFQELDRRTGFCVMNGSDSDTENYETALHRRKKIMRYIVGERYPLRTDRQLREHMTQAQDTGQVTYGAKGVSVLCSLKYFDIVHGFSVDYMHAVLLGVTRRLATLWFDSTNSGEDYYIARKIDEVDRRLTSISPPSNTRYVRPISDRVHWKANEWRGFLLYFGLPALLNILPPVYFSNFQKFVTAIYILSKDTMTYDDVDDANKLLLKFVREFQNLYGESNMVYNVHLCTHIATSVSRLGPLWANSAFPFESGNGRLVKLTKGTQGVATQIARKYLMAFSVPKLIRHDYKARESVIDFCSNIIGYKYLKNASICDDVNLLGMESYHELTHEQRQTFINRGILNAPKNIPVFNRVVKKGTLYCGRLTSKQVKFDDSCVRLTNGGFVRLQLIMKLTVDGVEKVWSICQKFNIAVDQPSILSPHIKQCSLNPLGSIDLLPFDDVEKKCMLISCGDKKYIAEFPNTYEKD